MMPGGTIIEPTSGNTGIGLALVAAVKGYKLILTMSEKMSVKRRNLPQAYGAELVLTPGDWGMLGAVGQAEQIYKMHPEYFMPGQFENQSNPDMYSRTTAMEIIDALNDTVPDALVAGVGTGGTITGVGEVFRQRRPDVLICAVEPAGSPILSDGNPGPHRMRVSAQGFTPVYSIRRFVTR